MSQVAAGQFREAASSNRVFFVESLPKNPSGKLLKRELRNRFT